MVNILPWSTWHPSRGSYNGVAHVHPSRLHYKMDARSLTLRSLLQPWLTSLWLVIIRFPLAYAHARVNDPLDLPKRMKNTENWKKNEAILRISLESSLPNLTVTATLARLREPCALSNRTRASRMHEES